MKKLLLLLCTLLGTAGAWADEVTITVSGTTGTFYTSGSTERTFGDGNTYYCNKWVSTATSPQLTLSCPSNNMVVDTQFRIHTDDYTMTPSDGAKIKSWSITAYTNSTTTSTIAGTTISTDASNPTTVTGTSNTFVVNTANPWIIVTNFTVTLELASEAQKAAYNTVQGWIPVIQSSNGLVKSTNPWTSNATDPGEGSLDCLIDGEISASSYFHSTWRGDVTDTHYLQADLPDAVNSLYLYYATRATGTGLPSVIRIDGSNDGTTWTEGVASISSGLPTTALTEYLSDKISLGSSYSHLRFAVTNTAASTIWFCMSEAYLLPSNAEIDAAITAYKTYKDVVAVDLTDTQIADINTVNTALTSTIVNVTYELYESDGTTLINSLTVEQNKNSEVSIPSSFQTNPYYYTYTTSGTIGTADCTIKVTRTMRPEIVYPYTNLSNNKSYYIKTRNNERGALSTYTADGTTYLASPVKSTLGISAKKFAILDYEDHYYLYSIDDQKFVTFEGAEKAPLAETPQGITDAIGFSLTTAPLYELRFDNSTSKIFNSSASYTNGIIFNGWGDVESEWDNGCQYTIEEAEAFDPTDAIAALENFFHPANYYSRVETEILPYLIEDMTAEEPELASSIGKPFGISEDGASEIVTKYQEQLKNLQFSLEEYEDAKAILEENIVYPENKVYLVKNTYNGKYLRVAEHGQRGQVFADLTRDEAIQDKTAHIYVKVVDGKPYMLSENHNFNWVYYNWDNYEAYTNIATNLDKYAHFVSVAPGVGAFSMALGNAEGDYAGYLYSGFYALKNGTTTVAGSPEGYGPNSEYAHWTFEELTIEAGDANYDGTVDATDVEALVSILLNLTGSEKYDADAADVDNSGSVTLSDITALVNKIKSASAQ